MIERGIVLGGQVVPGTDFVKREARCFWTPADSNDVRKRDGAKVDTIIAHWTGGHLKSGDGAGFAIYKAIEKRLRGDGSDMAVSCHFIIAADGGTWQTCDLLDATIHVGDRATYKRSVGVEVASPGTPEWAEKIGIDPAVLAARGIVTVKGEARGRTFDCLSFTKEAIGAWRALVDVLTKIETPAVSIPRRIVRTAGPGIAEHRDVRSTLEKVDAGGLLVGALDYPRVGA